MTSNSPLPWRRRSTTAGILPRRSRTCVAAAGRRSRANRSESVRIDLPANGIRGPRPLFSRRPSMGDRRLYVRALRGGGHGSPLEKERFMAARSSGWPSWPPMVATRCCAGTSTSPTPRTTSRPGRPTSKGRLPTRGAAVAYRSYRVGLGGCRAPPASRRPRPLQLVVLAGQGVRQGCGLADRLPPGDRPMAARARRRRGWRSRRRMRCAGPITRR